MKPEELSNYDVKVGKTSITAKDEQGKTRGLVRNIWKFMDLRPNLQTCYFKKLKELNIWGNPRMNINNVFMLDSQMYVLRDMRFPDRAAEVYEAIKADGCFEVIEARRIL